MKSNEFEYDKCTHLLSCTLESLKPVVIHEGGTSSSKTYSNVQACFLWAIEDPGSVTTVVAEDVPSLKKGAMRDASNILSDEPQLENEFKPLQKTDRFYESRGGSKIEFNSYEGFEDAKHGKRDYLFLNEVNSIGKDICEELMMRTTQKIVMDFNPNARFWVHDQYEDHPEERSWFVSNYTHNPFIPEKILKRILGYNPWHPEDSHLPEEERRPHPTNIERGTANEYRWKVYGLGEVGRLEGLVFKDWQVTNDWPEEYKWRVFGLDFGFTNDPTAFVEIRYAHGNLYWKEHIYQTGLTNPDISKELSILGHPKNELIVADSAEPKSIEELKRRGWNIVGAEKGKDSINQGIDAIKRYPIKVYAGSKNLIEEFSSYIWKEDKDGNPTNKPIDAFNHGIDGGRYGLSKKILKERRSLSPSNDVMV